MEFGRDEGNIAIWSQYECKLRYFPRHESVLTDDMSDNSDYIEESTDYIEESTDPSSVSDIFQNRANESEDRSGSSSKQSFSLDFPSVTSMLAQEPSNLEPNQIVLSGDHRSSRNRVSRTPSTTMRNSIQILAEKTIGSSIDWWPLTEPRRDLVRVTWSCVSKIAES